jgi:HTH-type transcriptional regulator/antitoxin HigA
MTHPGKRLGEIVEETGLSQRQFASIIKITHPLLNNIIKGNRDVNINTALSLEAAGYGSAKEWLENQIDYSLFIAKQESNVKLKEADIKLTKELSKIAPLAYFKKHQGIDVKSSEGFDKVLKIYNVNSLPELQNKIEGFAPKHFRKSPKFVENKNNVLAWLALAEFRLSEEEVNDFTPNEIVKQKLLEELRLCFYENREIISRTKEILNNVGIKFLTLDRPKQTPVDGKCFVSDKKPAIALSLKYKRLDSFAFTLFHELGHVFLHLSRNDNQMENKEFFVNSSEESIEEFEADKFARNNLIEPEIWYDFINYNTSFRDDVILSFAEKHKIHPGIVRGRLCFEKPEYYRKRTKINDLNKLGM